MCAKPAKKNAARSAVAVPPATVPAAAAPTEPAATTPTEQTPHAWMDSSDPRKRLLGRLLFVGVWLYVGALCLLALDQTFHWGIFGPKVPPGL